MIDLLFTSKDILAITSFICFETIGSITIWYMVKSLGDF